MSAVLQVVHRIPTGSHFFGCTGNQLFKPSFEEQVRSVNFIENGAVVCMRLTFQDNFFLAIINDAGYFRPITMVVSTISGVSPLIL
jgi:hypothetical protein